MQQLTLRAQTTIALALTALLVLTRGHHFATVAHVLPTASWAVFFLAGFYLRTLWMPVVLFGVAAFLDYAAVTWGGVSNFCVSPAYVALFPAYGALWAAGRWYAPRHRNTLATFAPLAASVFFGTLICELISGGVFYFYSERFANPTFVEFAARIGNYFPSSLASTAFWVAAAALAHTAIVMAQSRTTRRAI